MQEDERDQRWLSGFALPVSVGLHLVVAALLIFGLPHALQKPEKDQAVSVDLVPPPAPPEKPKSEPPAPQAKAEEPPEKKAEASPPTNQTPAPQPPVSRLRPVFQFGEKDAGPRKSAEGNSAQDEPKPVPKQPEPEDPTEQDASAAPDNETVLSLPDAAATPTPRPAKVPDARNPTRLKEAKTLFSRSATGDALATTAMGDLPRSVRGGTLCVTELREQLLRTSPPYFADLLPSYPLKTGTVIDVPKAAFRAGGQWQDLSYRCEVDEDATKVVSFAFRVGEPIPRSEWKKRGLPSG